MNCKKDINLNERIDYRVNSNIEVFFEFPDTVKVGKKNIANLVFYNRTFDTIIEPRVKGYVQFRVFLFSEFYPENTKTNNLRVFSDSILLDSNDIKISYKFDQPGTYRIGGLVRDELFYDYRFIKNDSMFIFKASKIVSKNVVVIE
nr:hypothetical protein [uncultured Flavobacterium sp.]